MRETLARMVRVGRSVPDTTPGPRRVLIVGDRGREHALAWRILADRPGSTVWATRGSDGMQTVATKAPIDRDDPDAIVAWCAKERPDLVVVGPLTPLRLGLVDQLNAAGIPVFGPTRAASRIEWSKQSGMEVAAAAGVPVPGTWSFPTADAAAAFVRSAGRPFVVKPDADRGPMHVVVCGSTDQTLAAIAAFEERERDRAEPSTIVLQEVLRGPEISFHLLCDGTSARFLGAARDAKRLLDGDRGPNTDGMGAFSPAPEVTPALRREIETRFGAPLLAELRRRGTPFTGFLYLGLMLTDDGPRLLELNARLGDPEGQVLLPLLRIDLVGAMEAAVIGRLDRFPWADPDGAAVCVVVVADGYPDPNRHHGGVEVFGLEDDAPGVQLFHGGTSRRLGRWWVWGPRVVGVTACGATVAEARERAQARVATIDFEGAHHRTDIAAGA